ncbi:histidine kinase [Streptomyces albus subsp. albus]|nr:histidine kinase [Streptomyces albus subsp. albus]
MGRRARLRWVHLVLGGALLTPYYLLTVVLIVLVEPGSAPLSHLPTQLLAFAAALPLAAVTALFPLVRPLEVTAARSLCGLAEPGVLADGPAASWDARSRTALWYTLHLAVGGLISGATLSLSPAAGYLLLPFKGGSQGGPGWLGRLREQYALLAPLAGMLLAVSLVAVVAGAGALLARCAPALLGPVPADRLAAAEARAAALASRNRLARELHDSVGHALSAVALQAGAARKLLDRDPDFARQALTAIEETARDAVGELDTVLGLLREDPDGGPSPGLRPGGPPAAPAPQPGLADLERLLGRTRAAGILVELTAPQDPPDALDRLPPVVSREAYRIVQEGLSNALRHAGQVPVRLRIAVHADHDTPEELEIAMENPVRGWARPRRAGGGRGLRGIAERAALLRGTAEWGTHGGSWRLTVRIPLAAAIPGGEGGR